MTNPPSYLGHPLASLTALRDHLEGTGMHFATIETRYSATGALVVDVTTTSPDNVSRWALYLDQLYTCTLNMRRDSVNGWRIVSTGVPRT